MISLRVKLLLNSFSVLGLAAISYTGISYLGLSKISDRFLDVSTERSEVVKKSYVMISDENVRKIRSIYEKGLTNKGRKMLSKDMASLVPMIADNSFLGVQQFLQRTFEDDKEIISATYFTAQGNDIKAWHYVSTEHPKGLQFPVVYNVSRKGWQGKTKAGQSVFIQDPNVLEILRAQKESVQYLSSSDSAHQLSKILFSVPFVDGKTGEAVKKARAKGDGVGYLRYVLSPEEMNRAVYEEETNLQLVLAALQEGNQQALKESKKLSGKAKEEVLFSLFVGTLLVTAIGYLISIVISGKMTRPLKRLRLVADEMAKGNYHQNIQVETNDEIGVLAQTFQKMSDAIRKRDAELEEINKNLEKLVETRTLQLKDENRKISALLNNMKQAVFSVSGDGQVVSPVSKYSEQVFGDAIEGKNIFDFLYHQFKPESEEYSKIYSNFGVTFGEGDLQWSLSEVNFPSRILLKADGSQLNDRVLRVNYSPLYDDSGSLEKIMLVVEDISELERLETQIVAQRAQLEILRQLTENDVEAVKSFFNSAGIMLSEVVRALRVDQVSAKQLPGILRNLHTIKGNARTLGLVKISAQTHESENDVVQIKQRVGTGSGILSPEDVQQCQAEVVAIRATLNEYLAVAKVIYGVKNDLQMKVQTDLHQTLIDIGWELARRKDLNLILHHIDTALQLSADLDEKPIQKVCVRIREAHLRGELGFDGTIWLELLLQGVGLIYKTGIFVQHTTQSSIWVGLADQLWNISNALENFRKISGTQSNLPFMTAIEQAISYCVVNGLQFFTGYFQTMDVELRKYVETGDVRHLDESDLLEKEVWKQLLFTAQFHVGLKLPDKDKKSVANCLAVLVDGPAGFDVILESISQFDHWLISITRHFSQKEGLLTAFYQRWADRLHIGLPQFFHTVVHAPPGWVENRLDLREALTCGQMGNRIYSLLQGFLSPRVHVNSYLKALDVLQLIAGSIEDPELLKGRYRTLEVLEMNINNLKSFLLNRLYALGRGEEIAPIIRAVDRLLEVPLKPVLWSYQKMVEELTHKLGKKVNFVVHGDDVMLSKDTLRLLQDGIMHILRNAIDHGIETQEERVQGNKPAVAQLVVECFYRFGQIVVSVNDDGRGIDPVKVAAIAIQKGVLDPKREKAMSDQERVELILVPGFSTRDEVTELSGRGVGLDVAKRNVEDLGGTLVVQSNLGLGSLFEMIIPI